MELVSGSSCEALVFCFKSSSGSWNCVVVRPPTVVCVPHGAREDSQPYTYLYTHMHLCRREYTSMIAVKFVRLGCFCFVLCCGSTHALAPSQGRDRHPTTPDGDRSGQRTSGLASNTARLVLARASRVPVEDRDQVVA